VDNIHTDGPPLTSLGFGTFQEMGHADFYPNGGEDQPGCSTLKVGCSHGRAPDLYISSIEQPKTRNPCVLEGKPCSSKSQWKDGKCESCGNGCSEMGYNAYKNTKTVQYYLSTSSKYPFCK